MGSTQETVNRAIQYSNPGTIETKVVELPIEEPGPGEVLVRMMYSGVCHTDYAACTNAWFELPPGQIGGHEGVGKIIAHGAGVKTPALDTVVGIKFAAAACLNCDRCLTGGETSCASPEAKISGIGYPGTFQQYVVSSAAYVTPIPDGLDFAAAGPLMCAGITVYTALTRARIRHGDWVLISGAGGGLGHLAIQYAKALGARVCALDSGAKEKFCRDLGADAFVDFQKYSTDEELVAEVKKSNADGMKIVLVCSDNNKAYTQAMMFLGFRGVMVCLGYPAGAPVPIGGALIGPMIQNELTIFAIKSGNRQEARECLDIASRGLVKTHYQLRNMDSLSEIFAEMETHKISGRIVIDLR